MRKTLSVFKKKRRKSKKTLRGGMFYKCLNHDGTIIRKWMPCRYSNLKPFNSKDSTRKYLFKTSNEDDDLRQKDETAEKSETDTFLSPLKNGNLSNKELIDFYIKKTTTQDDLNNQNNIKILTDFYFDAADQKQKKIIHDVLGGEKLKSYDVFVRYDQKLTSKQQPIRKHNKSHPMRIKEDKTINDPPPRSTKHLSENKKDKKHSSTSSSDSSGKTRKKDITFLPSLPESERKGLPLLPEEDQKDYENKISNFQQAIYFADQDELQKLITYYKSLSTRDNNFRNYLLTYFVDGKNITKLEQQMIEKIFF